MKLDRYIYFSHKHGNLQLVEQETWEKDWFSWWKETQKKQKE
jgi:hypothetical protein